MITEKKINPIIAVPGSKARVAKAIISLFPSHHRYIEPFCGTAAVLLQKQPCPIEIINDIHSELFNLYKVIIFNYEPFKEKVKWFMNHEQLFHYFRDLQTDEPLMRALKFYYLSKFGFVQSQKNIPHFQLSKIKATRAVNMANLDLFRERMKRVQIVNRDYKDFIPYVDHEEALYYLDPPYYQKGNILYKFSFKHEDHEILSEILQGLKGKFVLSYNDCEEVRALYSWAKIRNLKIQYSMMVNGCEHTNELLITNY